MKLPNWFSYCKNPSYSRLGIAGVLLFGALALTFAAAKTSTSPKPAKLSGKYAAMAARSAAFAKHLQTVLGRGNETGGYVNGRAQEDYDNRAYPATAIKDAQVQTAATAASSHDQKVEGNDSEWKEIGPSGVPADALVASESTGATAGTIFSGRATAIAVSPRCKGDDCKIYIAAAGGGVWKSDHGTKDKPDWKSVSKGIPSNAIGSLIFDPTDKDAHTLYVGTGEPNGSGDSEAGVGLYKSTDEGNHWTLVAGSTASTAPCANQPGSCPVATGRSIGAIAVDPANPNHIFIGTDVARHGSSSINGGRFTPPGTAVVGLYESTDGGATFSLAFNVAGDNPNGGTATGGDFFRGGVSHIELYRPGSETQVYASVFDYGLYRRSMTQDGDTAFHQVFNAAGGGTVGQSSFARTEFSLAPNAGNLRIYLGDASSSPADFYRVDNANVTAATLVTGGTNGGWMKLSNPANGTPGFASYNYCSTQCSYDMPVYSPPGSPDIVYIGSSMQYGELGGRSNGRAIQRSEDAGVNFTDMTIDTQGISLHPDQHTISSVPGSPNVVFIGNDGGIWRLNGSFTDVSGQCASRNLSPNSNIDCTHWLSKVPTTISTMNDGLGTLQFQSLSVNANQAQSDLMGGTQDNGTHAFSSKNKNGDNGNWFVTIFGDGGQSFINPNSPNIRGHTFFDAQIDMNFQAEYELGWDWVSDTFFTGAAAGENRSFYIPLIYDQVVNGTAFTGLEHVWRTQDDNGGQSFLDSNCSEFFGTFAMPCGDWAALGSPKLTDPSFGSDKQANSAGYIVALRRAASDHSTLWVGLRRGRVFVTSNADNATASAVTFYRIDTSAQPTRFVSGIDVDPANPNHAFISYSGYNAYDPVAGHLFEVTYNPVSHTAVWSGDLAGDLGDQPVTNVAVDYSTGDVYLSTDFGVYMRPGGSTTFQPAGRKLPTVAVYGLTLDPNSRMLFAATHGRGAWKLKLNKFKP
jgi:hypothetical protein